METVEIAVGLVRSSHKPGLWLGKFNPALSHIEFVIANRLQKESFRETIIREIAWELGLDREKDFIVSNMAQLNCDFQATLPNQHHPSHILCSFYNVDLYRKQSLESVEKRNDLHWLDSVELCDGTTDTGISVCPLFVLLNQQAKVIQRWESRNQ